MFADFGDDSPSVGPTPETPTAGPSPASTKAPRGFLDEGVRAGFAKGIKAGAMSGSAFVEMRAGLGTGAMLMLEDEADDIATPASRLMARHIPLPGGAGGASDAGDIIALVVALGGYVLAAFTRRAQILTGQLEPAAPRGFVDDHEYDIPVDDDPPPAVASWPGTTSTPEVGLGR